MIKKTKPETVVAKLVEERAQRSYASSDGLK